MVEKTVILVIHLLYLPIAVDVGGVPVRGAIWSTAFLGQSWAVTAWRYYLSYCAKANQLHGPCCTLWSVSVSITRSMGSKPLLR